MSRPSIDEMRTIVSQMYDGPAWKRQVKNMPNGQILAIFMRQQNKRQDVEAKARAEKRRAARGQLPPNDDIPF